MKADQLFVWVNKHHRYLSVRVTQLSPREAVEMQEEWGGTVAKFHHTWQWEISGKGAIRFLAQHTGEWALKVVDREPQP